MKPSLNSASDYVMGRMEWFRDLRRVFSRLTMDVSSVRNLSTDSVSLQEFLEEISSRANEFELKDPEEYNTRSNHMAFSLQEVMETIISIDQFEITWDQIIDSLIALSVQKKKSSRGLGIDQLDSIQGKTPHFRGPKPVLEVSTCTLDQLSMIDPESCKNNSIAADDASIMKDLQSPQYGSSVYSTPKVSQRSQDAPCQKQRPLHSFLVSKRPEQFIPTQSNLLDLSRRHDKLTAFTLKDLGSDLMYLNLAGNLLSHCRWNLPESLVALNLSSNEVQELDWPRPLPNLRLLNIAHNYIKRLQNLPKIRNVEEFVLSHNQVTSLGLLCQLQQLSILDASSNQIANFEDLAGLAVNPRLTILKLQGNPIAGRQGYTQAIESLIPKIQHLDLKSVKEYSNYENLVQLMYETQIASPVLSTNASAYDLGSQITRMQKVSGPQHFHTLRKQLVGDKVSLNIPSKEPRDEFRVSSMTEPGPENIFRNSNISASTSKQSHRARSPIKPVYIKQNTPTKSLKGSRSNQSAFKTPPQNKRPSSAHGKSQTPSRTAPSELLAKVLGTPQRGSAQESYEATMNFLSQAENRLQGLNSHKIIRPQFQNEPRRESREVSIVTQDSISRLQAVQYGNPLNALMIGPPAVGGQGRGRKIVQFSLRKK